MRVAAFLTTLAAACYTSGPEGEPDSGFARQCLSINTISSVSPAKVDVSGGTQITITGSNFEGGTPPAKVELGPRACLDVQVKTATQIACVTPPVPAEGKVDVQVINGGKSACVRSAPCAQCLEFADIMGPRLTEFSPAENSEVSVLVSLRARFDEALKPASVRATTFFISGPNAAGTVFCDFDCTLECGGASNLQAICVKPSQPLAYDTEYAGVIRDSVTDVKDNRLAGASSDGTVQWKFRTCAQGADCPTP